MIKIWVCVFFFWKTLWTKNKFFVFQFFWIFFETIKNDSLCFQRQCNNSSGKGSRGRSSSVFVSASSRNVNCHDGRLTEIRRTVRGGDGRRTLFQVPRTAKFENLKKKGEEYIEKTWKIERIGKKMCFFFLKFSFKKFLEKCV